MECDVTCLVKGCTEEVAVTYDYDHGPSVCLYHLQTLCPITDCQDVSGTEHGVEH